ncbi:hypothetical protein F8388_019569 [Cannabis sativa]|uniref:Retrotransposon gag domain-containing protein n=1 Tax=Cannabis sativa TaxID=3483 RepID=A0A7J6FF68_CANSA|nr:hypothetical protein F8388_019569 [Cannabis sativa]
MADELCSLRESQAPMQSSGRRSVNERPSSPAVMGSIGRDGEGGRRSEFRARKIELPVYSGDDPDEWTYRVDRYFGLQRLSPAEQLEAAIMCLEGAALNWFRWENSRHVIRSWEELKGMLIHRFRSAHEGPVYDRFFSLRQTETVQDYRRKFESLAAAMGTMGDQGLQAAFVNGLRMDIQGPLRLLHPNGLIRAMKLAESIEANQALVRNHRIGPNKSFINRSNSLILPESRAPHVTTSPTYSTTTVHSKGSSASSSSSPTSFKRFTEAELREKKERGVCFKCDGRWFRGHECKEAELVVVVQQVLITFFETDRESL